MTHEIEVWVLVDSDGEYVVGKDQSDLGELYANDIGESGAARRMIKLTVKVPVVAHVELTGTAPHEGQAALTVS